MIEVVFVAWLAVAAVALFPTRAERERWRR
jgi:hypothetical protein